MLLHKWKIFSDIAERLALARLRVLQVGYPNMWLQLLVGPAWQMQQE